jgi:hypothetical protein
MCETKSQELRESTDRAELNPADCLTITAADTACTCFYFLSCRLPLLRDKTPYKFKISSNPLLLHLTMC